MCEDGTPQPRSLLDDSKTTTGRSVAKPHTRRTKTNDRRALRIRDEGNTMSNPNQVDRKLRAIYGTVSALCCLAREPLLVR